MEEEERVQGKEPNHLRSVNEVKGYNIHATDGRIGDVEDFTVGDKTWIIRYAAVDTRKWLPGGKKILVSTDWINVRDVEKNNSPILLVFWPVFCVALRGTDNEYAPLNAP